ncbi:hypothetical protein BJX99DRAFT_270791 [Aspergillus californicus]
MTMDASEVTNTGSTPSTSRSSFLADLMDPTCPIPTYAYRGPEEFLKDKEDAFNRYLSTSDIFSDVRAYDGQAGAVLLLIVSDAHHAAASAFDNFLNNAVNRQGLNLTPCEGTRQTAEDGSKNPDGAWRPSRLPRDRSVIWPSIVLEVSYSETRAKLMSDIRWWFRASLGDVKVVMTVDIDRHSPIIVIEQWVRDRIGRHRQQTIRITNSGAGAVIIGAPLKLSHERIFLGPPATPAEGTIWIREPALKNFAEAVWENQGFKDVERM